MARALGRGLLLSASAALASAGCSNAGWRDAYSPERCHVEGDAAVVQCLGRSGDECGMRMESTSRVGVGLHAMGIKAAPGSGVATTFYLADNDGMYDKSCTRPWVELDFEIMGNQVGPHSKIWTNMFTGTCQEHWKFITVPFDVSADYHTYAFRITEGSISWLVDGVAYRTESIAQHEDAQASARASSFGQFVSVWGKSTRDAGEGIMEFQNALGKLDYNSRSFPLFAGFKRDVAAAAAAGPGAGSAAPSQGSSHAVDPASCQDGPGVWQDCLASRCCSDGTTCFAKSDTYAQCRPSCAPGIHADDQPQYRTAWSCSVLSPPARRLSSELLV